MTSVGVVAGAEVVVVLVAGGSERGAADVVGGSVGGVLVTSGVVDVEGGGATWSTVVDDR